MSSRSAAALQHILVTHAGDVDALVGRYVDDEMDRDDLRQEIAIAVWRAMPRFLGESSERTYVLRIAQNRAISFRLRWKRTRSPGPNAKRFGSASPRAAFSRHAPIA